MPFRNSKSLVSLLIVALFVLGCSVGTNDSDNEEGAPTSTQAPKTNTPKQQKIRRASEVDVIALSNKSVKRFDAIFGDATKITKIKDNPKLMPGEYREYQIEGHPKGLSVRFYRNKAQRFNLLLGKPEKSASSALGKIFKIKVAKMKRVQGDPLSATWRGKSGSVVFKTAYAKRIKAGGNFVMLHAEIAK